MTSHEYAISDEVKLKIVKDHIEPLYVNDVDGLIDDKKCWNKTGQVFETVSKILLAVGGILSFSSGYYDDRILSFLAGSVSTISLATLQFASFSYKESKKSADELNIILQKLKLETIPVYNRATEQDLMTGTSARRILTGMSPSPTTLVENKENELLKGELNRLREVIKNEVDKRRQINEQRDAILESHENLLKDKEQHKIEMVNLKRQLEQKEQAILEENEALLKDKAELENEMAKLKNKLEEKENKK